MGNKMLSYSISFLGTSMLIAGMCFMAKPAYHFAKRELAKWESRERWDKRMSSSETRAEAAWLRVPELGIDTLVLDSDDKDDLLDFPILAKGNGKIKLIMAHRDIHFKRIGKIGKTDEIELQLANGKMEKYRAIDSEVISPENVIKRLKSKRDEKFLVLMTCHPFNYIGAAPNRFLLWCALETCKKINNRRKIL